MLLEADRPLGRAAYKWLGWGDPDATSHFISRNDTKTCRATEITLWELAGAIPNDSLSWDDWNAFGLAFFAASVGSDEGFNAFDRFSAQSSKYIGAETRARWRHYDRSPPSKSGIGKLIAQRSRRGARRTGVVAKQRDFIRLVCEQAKAEKARASNRSIVTSSGRLRSARPHITD